MSKSTKVAATYTPSLNTSVTTIGDQIVLVTLWSTGDDATKTIRFGETSDQRNPFSR